MPAFRGRWLRDLSVDSAMPASRGRWLRGLSVDAAMLAFHGCWLRDLSVGSAMPAFRGRWLERFVRWLRHTSFPWSLTEICLLAPPCQLSVVVVVVGWRDLSVQDSLSLEFVWDNYCLG